jgi:hypothetical protein
MYMYIVTCTNVYIKEKYDRIRKNKQLDFQSCMIFYNIYITCPEDPPPPPPEQTLVSEDFPSGSVSSMLSAANLIPCV